MNQEDRTLLLEKLKEKYPILEQVKFNEFNVSEKIEKNMEWRISYQELYEHNLFIYDKLLEKYEELKGKRYDYWRFESDRKLLKSEIEQYYLPTDEKLKKFRQLLDKQKLKVDFFKLCMESIERCYWRIKEWKNE